MNGIKYYELNVDGNLITKKLFILQCVLFQRKIILK